MALNVNSLMVTIFFYQEYNNTELFFIHVALFELVLSPKSQQKQLQQCKEGGVPGGSLVSVEYST